MTKATEHYQLAMKIYLLRKGTLYRKKGGIICFFFILHEITKPTAFNERERNKMNE